MAGVVVTKSFKDQIRPYIVKALQKAKVNRLAHRVYYRYVHGFDTANKAVLDAQKRCFEHALASGVAFAGDYMEFGIFKGYAFWHAQKVANDNKLTDIRFFGFDSFAGLPDVTGNDVSKNDVFYKGQYTCDKETVTKNLDLKGIDWSRTYLVEGYFNDSLTPELRKKYNLNKISIALIDCDLYSSTKDVLDYIGDMVVDQTLFMFDDWNCYDRDDNHGQRKAFREFLEQNTALSAESFFEYGAYGQVFIMRKKS